MDSPDGRDMTDEEKCADYLRMKSLYNRMLRGVQNSAEEADFQVSLTLLREGQSFHSDESFSVFIDHINAYRAREVFLDTKIQDLKKRLYEAHRGLCWWLTFEKDDGGLETLLPNPCDVCKEMVGCLRSESSTST